MTEQQKTTPEILAERTQADTIHDRFMEDQHGHMQAWLEIQAKVPDRLHHYTTIDGLEGITDSSTLWASDVRFMNDSSEHTYAFNLILEVIQEVFSEVADESLRQMLPSREHLTIAFAAGDRPFIACFCEEENLLSQWRGYGRGLAPVSLGLELQHLLRSRGLPPRTYLRKVQYKAEVQRQTVRDVIETWLGTIESFLAEVRGPALGEILPDPGTWALQDVLAEHLVCFKHPDFEEEKEWRLIKFVEVEHEIRRQGDRRREEMWAAYSSEVNTDLPDSRTPWAADTEGIDIKFRRSALGMVPYVEIPLRNHAGVFGGRLPLGQVMQGPTSEPELAIESLSMFLESKGYGFHTEVKTSGTPLRP